MEELELKTKEHLWMNQYQTFMNSNCDNKGRLKADNMTLSERRGFMKLLKRNKYQDIIISKTDKSSKNTVSSKEAYIAQGQVHVQGDIPVTWRDFNKSKNQVLAHTKVLSNVFNVGQAHGDKAQTRLKNALHENISVIPNLTMHQKDHKDLNPQTGLPKTRPVCEASSTHNQRCSNLLTDIMVATFQSEKTCVSNSTEDLLSKVDKFNN